MGSKYIAQPENQTINFSAQLPTVVERFKTEMHTNDAEAQGNSCSYQAKLNEQNLFINDALTAQSAQLLWNLLIDGYIQNAGFFLNLKTFKMNPILL